MVLQAPDAPTIQITEDYGQFKLMGGNREIDYNHVKRLKKEMEYNPTMMQAAPILVNEHMFVVDGQHRLKAAEELNLPVSHIVKTGLSIEAARHMNVTQKRWALMDFAKSFADGGNINYINFIRVTKQFPDIAPSIVMKFLAGGDMHEMSGDFRRGSFKIDNLDQSKEWLEMVNEVRVKSRTTINTPMAMSLLKMFKGKNEAEDFDFGKFLKKLDHDGAKQLFNPSDNARNCLRSIEDVYNFMSNTRIRLY